MTQSKPTQRARRHFPDGVDANQYKKCSEWSLRRWAWEFLARDVYFIHDCENVETGLADAKEIAKKYRLKYFKYFDEELKSGTGIPRFTIGKVTWKDNVQADSDSIKWNTTIHPGQVLFRFDIKAASLDRRALENQIDSAKEKMNGWIRQYSKRKPKAHPGHKDNFVNYLRILDMLWTGKKPLDCAKILFPNMANKYDRGELTKIDLHNKIGWMVKSARYMASEGCRYLVLEKDEISRPKRNIATSE